MALAVTAFERQRVAFPHIPGKATPQLFIQFAPLVLVPYRAGLPPVAVFGAGFLVQATTQRVVGKADGEAVIFVTARQSSSKSSMVLRFLAYLLTCSVMTILKMLPVTVFLAESIRFPSMNGVPSA